MTDEAKHEEQPYTWTLDDQFIGACDTAMLPEYVAEFQKRHAGNVIRITFEVRDPHPGDTWREEQNGEPVGLAVSLPPPAAAMVGAARGAVCGHKVTEPQTYLCALDRGHTGTCGRYSMEAP